MRLIFITVFAALAFLSVSAFPEILPDPVESVTETEVSDVTEILEDTLDELSVKLFAFRAGIYPHPYELFTGRTEFIVCAIMDP
uniref:Uncharacterized protein n=1 Tax=Phlebotomus papatasi TaxID=29031 RepID=A0A1B0DE69_PHLPP